MAQDCDSPCIGERSGGFEGKDLPDREAIRECAIAAARSIMCAEVEQGRLCLACSIEVVGADGEPVMSVPFREAIIVTGHRLGSD